VRTDYVLHSSRATLSLVANVTLRLDDTLLREARVLAAHRGTSVSRLVAEELERLVRQDKAYARAQRRALRRLGEAYQLDWTAPADRGELHER
jgi:hypothetical protein